MKSIESLLKQYDPLEPSAGLLAKGVELIRHHRSNVAEIIWRWRLATTILSVLLVGSAIMNVMLWFEDQESLQLDKVSAGKTIYVSSNMLRQKQGHFVREIRYDYVPKTGGNKK